MAVAVGKPLNACKLVSFNIWEKRKKDESRNIMRSRPSPPKPKILSTIFPLSQNPLSKWRCHFQHNIANIISMEGTQPLSLPAVEEEESDLPFPMLVLPPSHSPDFTLQSLLHNIVNQRGRIEIQLQQVGAMLFRGFPAKTASDFNAFLEAFGWEEQSYVGAGFRTQVEGRVYAANEAALHQLINFHHEMSMSEEFPANYSSFVRLHLPTAGIQRSY